MKHPDCVIVEAPQGSDEWRAARLGRLTGSRAKDMLATIKSGGEAAARSSLRTALCCERLTGQPVESDYVSPDMLRGLALEAEARAVYEIETGHTVRQTGFVARTDLMVGCSLDGDIGDGVGIVEIKCPKSNTHLRYLRLGTLPSDYQAQVTHNLWVTGAQWCDFVSYDPRFPMALQLFVVRVEAATINIAAYEGLVRAFLREVEAEQAELLAMMAARAR